MKLLSLTVFLTITTSLFAQDADPRTAIAADNPHLNVRSDLRHLRHAIEVKKKCQVAFLGGSITENTGGHTAMVPAWLKKTYPETEFTFNNTGLGSTCSTSGAFRVGSHVFGEDKGTVDLLIVEFAVNDDQDATHPKTVCIRGMEGIIRQVRRNHPHCDVLVVHYVNPGILKKLQDGKTPTSIAAHEEVAERHGVISVNVAAEVADATKAERYAWKDYGGTHPKKFGYQVASNMIIRAIEAGLKKAEPSKTAPEAHALSDAIDAGSYQNASLIDPAKAKRSPSWKLGKVSRELMPLGSIRSQYLEYPLLRGEKPGEEITLEFEGRTVGAFILAGPDAGITEASIDGGEFVKQDLFHRFSGGLNYPCSVIFATDLTPGAHTLTLRMSGEKNPKSKGTTASIMFFEVNQ